MQISEIFTPACPWTALEQSARAAIHGQILEAGRVFWKKQEQKLGYNAEEGVPCPINSSQMMIKKHRRTWDVDHFGNNTTFSLLLARWVNENKIDVSRINFNHNRTRFSVRTPSTALYVGWTDDRLQVASRHHEEHWAEWHR